MKRQHQEEKQGKDSKKARERKTDGNLNEEQQASVDHALSGKNVFVTGSAGVGKSYTLHSIVSELKKAGKKVGIAAPTGISALQVGGSTLFSLFSIHPNMLEDGTIRFCKRWTELDVLVIDEVSMLDPVLFAYLDKHARKSRNESKSAFGGVQLVLIGDYFQLPPVSKDHDPTKPEFVFEMDLYKNMGFFNVELTQVFRQKDKKFVALLQAMRQGQLTEAHIRQIEHIMKNPPPPETEKGIRYTKLYGRRADVASTNHRELQKVAGKSTMYRVAFDFVESNISSSDQQKMQTQILKNLPVDPVLEVRIGAQVMLLANLDVEAGLANGSRGVVLEFVDGYPVVQFDEFKACIRLHEWEIKPRRGVKVIVRAVPLKLAYAITMHKSQGQSINMLEIDVACLWECGQCYTAFSRATSLDTLRVIGFKPEAVITHPKVKEFYSTMEVCV
jgi:ATP-dependent DNA helicase PIF1